MDIKNPVELVAETLMDMLKHAVTAVLVGLLLMFHHNPAMAATGGRMGGSSFSSRSSRSSSSSSSRSYSTPRASSSSLRSYSTPRASSSSSSRSYSTPSASSSSRSYSTPSVSTGSSYFSYSSSPSYSSNSSLPDRAKDFVINFIFFFLVLAVFASVCNTQSSSSVRTATSTATVKTTVVKLQVGLLGSGRSLQKDLNRIAESADTSTPEGQHYVLTETVLALLRHPDYRISVYSSVDVKRSLEEGEKAFNLFSVEERGNFDEETLVNVNNIKKQSSPILKADGFRNEHIVITVLVAAEGEHALPSIKNNEDLKEALQKLASIPSSRTLAVEVLWTPQNEDDTLSEREILENYPLLQPL